jgi:Na+-transporting NADH:ubiquinone oxidoreductase subunit B
VTRGLWTRETVAALTLAALMPLAVFWLWTNGLAGLVNLIFAVIIIGIWHLVFMLVRAQPPSLSALITGLAIAMLAPEELGVFRLALGISFGVVMGELVFGGWGRNVVNPATVALAFLGFGFPAAPWPGFDAPIAWAAIPAAALGATLGIMPLALLLSAAAVAAGALMLGFLPEPVLFAAGIGLVLLVADPVTSAATGLGRVLNGTLYALFVVFFAAGWSGAAAVQITVASALLASLAAPLLDDIAIQLWVSRRRRRHGRT